MLEIRYWKRIYFQDDGCGCWGFSRGVVTHVSRLYLLEKRRNVGSGDEVKMKGIKINTRNYENKKMQI